MYTYYINLLMSIARASRETKFKYYSNLITTLCEICNDFQINIKLPDGSYDNDKIEQVLNELIRFDTRKVNERINNILIENIDECTFIDTFNNTINHRIVLKCPIDGCKIYKENKCGIGCRLCKCCSKDHTKIFDNNHCECCAELLSEPGDGDTLCHECQSK